MLKAFQEKLARLANDPQDPFRRRVTERVGPLEAPRIEAPLRRMILAMPDMLGQIAAWSRELGVPQPLKRAQVFALAYIVNPEDLLPEGDAGLYGYLDDAYIVAATYYRTMQEVGPRACAPDRQRVPGPRRAGMGGGLSALLARTGGADRRSVGHAFGPPRHPPNGKRPLVGIAAGRRGNSGSGPEPAARRF